MNNTLTSLNNALFEEIERLQNDDLDAQQFEMEAKRATVVSNIADKIIRNGELALKTMEHLNEYGYGTGTDDSFVDLAGYAACGGEISASKGDNSGLAALSKRIQDAFKRLGEAFHK